MKNIFQILFLISFQHSFSQKTKIYFIDTYGDKVKEQKAIYKRSVTKLNEEWKAVDSSVTGGCSNESYLHR